MSGRRMRQNDGSVIFEECLIYACHEYSDNNGSGDVSPGCSFDVSVLLIARLAALLS